MIHAQIQWPVDCKWDELERRVVAIVAGPVAEFFSPPDFTELQQNPFYFDIVTRIRRDPEDLPSLGYLGSPLVASG